MTKNLLRTIFIAILAGFVLLSNDIAWAGTGTDEAGNTAVISDSNSSQHLRAFNCDAPLSAKLNETRRCFLCPLFKILFTASASVSVASFEHLAEPFQIILVIGFGLYIAYLTLLQVSAFTKQDGSKYISELLIMGFKVLVAWLLLANGEQVYRYGLEPILSAGMEIGSSFLSSSSSDKVSNIASCQASPTTGQDRTFYSDAFEKKINCFLEKLAEETAVSHVIGSSIYCVAKFPQIGAMISGLLIMGFSFFVSIAFAFYLIDSIVRLGILGAILPFLIAAWPFKKTAQYTSKGWSMFLNAFFVFVFLGLIMAVVVEIVASAITKGDGNAEEVMGYIANDNVTELGKYMSMGGAGFLFLVICGLFAFKLCKEAAALASEMGTSGGTPIGSQIGGLATSAARWGAGKTLKAAGGGAKWAAHVLPGGGGESLASRANIVKNSIAGGVNRFTKALTNPLTPDGRLNSGSGGNIPLPDPDDPNNTTGGPNGGGDGLNGGGDGSNGGGNGPNGGGSNGDNGSGSGGDESDVYAGGGTGGSNKQNLNNDKNGGDAETASGNQNSNTTPDNEVDKAGPAKENRASNGSGGKASEGNKRDLGSEAIAVAERVASKYKSQGQEGTPEGNQPIQRAKMKEGKVVDQNGKLQSETNRSADGGLVKTEYDKKGNVSSIVNQDKNGNREWQKYDEQGNVVESGNIKMGMNNGRPYVKEEQISKADGSQNVSTYHSNGKLKSESSYAKDGSFKQRNYDINGNLQDMREFNTRTNMESISQYKNGKIIKEELRDFANNTIVSSVYNKDLGRAVEQTRDMNASEQLKMQNDIAITQKHHNIGSKADQMPQDNVFSQSAQPVQNGDNKQTVTPENANSQPAPHAQGGENKHPEQPTQAQSSTNQTSNNEAIADTKSQTTEAKPFEHLREGVVTNENGDVVSRTVKHDNGTMTRVISSDSKIREVAEEDESGNRKWQCLDENQRPTVNGTRTVNDDGSLTYNVFDSDNKLMSKTVENADGSSVQTIYKDGEAYVQINKDVEGNVTYAPVENNELKPEASSNLVTDDKPTLKDIVKEELFKDSKNSDNSKKDDESEKNKLKVKELESLVSDLMKVAGALQNNGDAAVSLASVSVELMKQELRSRGVKID